MIVISFGSLNTTKVIQPLSIFMAMVEKKDDKLINLILSNAQSRENIQLLGRVWMPELLMAITCV